jgi:hypothetical protein
MLGESSGITRNVCAPRSTLGQEKRASYAAVDALKKEVVESYPEEELRSDRWRRRSSTISRKRFSATTF